MMIRNDQELQAMRERIAYFEQQVETLRRMETHGENYRAPAGGFLADIERMTLEIREYRSPR